MTSRTIIAINTTSKKPQYDALWVNETRNLGNLILKVDNVDTVSVTKQDNNVCVTLPYTYSCVEENDIDSITVVHYKDNYSIDASVVTLVHDTDNRVLVVKPSTYPSSIYVDGMEFSLYKACVSQA